MTSSSTLPRLLALALAASFALAGTSLRAEAPASPEAIEEIAPGSASHERPAAAVQLMQEAREATERSDKSAALLHYRRVIRHYSTSLLAPEAHFQSALIRLERKQWARAFDHFQAIVDNHPEYPSFNDVIRHQYDIAEALRTGARLRLFWRVPGFRSAERAVQYFEQVVENAPFSELAPEALIKAARLQGEQRKLDEAIDLYDRFISDYPEHERAPDAYFGLAAAFSTRVRGPAYDQGANREAISYYEDFILLFPRHPRAGEAEENIEQMQEILAQSRVVLGDFYHYRRRNFPAARIFYNEAITIAPVSPTAEEARQKLIEVDRRAAGS
jgi:outer membrane protein assembly factor BamD